MAADPGAAACCRRDQPNPTLNPPLDGDGHDVRYAVHRPRRHDRRGRPNASPAAGLRCHNGCPIVDDRSVAAPAPRRRVRVLRPTALTGRSAGQPAAGPPPGADRPHESDRSRIDPAPHPAWSSRRGCHSRSPELSTARQTLPDTGKQNGSTAVRHDHHTVDSPSKMVIESIDAHTTQETRRPTTPSARVTTFPRRSPRTSPSDALWPLRAADSPLDLPPVGWTERRPVHSFVRGS